MTATQELLVDPEVGPARPRPAVSRNHLQRGFLHLTFEPYSSAVTEPVILADVVRSGFVEGHHRGSVVVTAPDGSVEWSAGVVDRPMFPRSSNKPMQALGMLRSGLDLDGELLALAGASHSGEEFHLAGVRRILAGAGLDESALRTPPAYPIDEQARDEWVRAGHGLEPITMNCSGKHAAMIATCVVERLADPRRRARQEPRRRLGPRRLPLAGTPAAAGDPDGGRGHGRREGLVRRGRRLRCADPRDQPGRLARSFGLFAAAAADTLEGRIANAFREYPEYASGSRRDEAALMKAIPGLFCKAGAESVYAVGLADGRGIAVKIEDGHAARPRGRHGRDVSANSASTTRSSTSSRTSPCYGGGVQVGSVQPHTPAFS